MLRLLRFFRPFVWHLALLISVVFLVAAANLALPDFMARIVNEGILGRDLSAVWRSGSVMVALAAAAAVGSIVVGYLASRVAAGVARDLRYAVFERIESFALTEFNAFSTASLITRTTGDVQQIQQVLVIALRLALMAPFMGGWAIFKAYRTAPSMTWVMGLGVAVIVASMIGLFTAAAPRFKTFQKLTDRLNLVSREILTGLRVIRAFNREAAAEEKFEGVNEETRRLGLFVSRLMVLIQPMMMLVMNLVAIATVWFGARLVSLEQLPVGQMLAFIEYATSAVFSFMMISMVFVMMPRAAVSAERLAEVLATEPSVRDPERPVAMDPGQRGRVEFDRVSFAYVSASDSVLHEVSFTAEPGETTAIVGSTGSGKSTIINLVPRFYDATTGTVRVGGVDVRQLRLEDLYACLGYVPQRGILFSGTVESNLRFGAPDATDAELRAAAAIAQAAEFIDQLEGHYTAPIAQAGTNVSGGQKQRLSIARAVVRQPDIFIFDDSFSALDFATDAKLRRALAAATVGRTVIVVAQRISTVLDADKIVVVSEGRVVGQGRHRDLMASCSVYRELAMSQLSEEELKRL